MSEFSYIEHLNIPTKYKGSILHSYEYNATVGKINEIIDNMQVSYEMSLNFPEFTVTHNPLLSTAVGTGVTINNDTDGKLYPVTSSSYVVTGPATTLASDLADIRNDITSNLSYVCELIASAEAKTNNLSDSVDGKFIQVYNKINGEILPSIISYHTESVNGLSELRSYVDDKVSEILSLLDNLNIDIDAGNGISIDNGTISVKPDEIVDNHSIYVNSEGKLVVNNEVVLANAESKFKFIDEHGNWVGDMANVKNYIDNSINTAYNNLKDDISYIYAYMEKFIEYDEYGKNYKLSEQFMNEQI